MGNIGLKDIYQQLISEYRTKKGENAFVEFTVKGYNDGTLQSTKYTLDSSIN